jgi:6-phosphogluconolactonase
MGITIAFGATAEEDALKRVYLGTYTGASSQGIYLVEVHEKAGRLFDRGLAAKTENPSFLAMHPKLPVLYAVGEIEGDGDGGTISAFRIDAETGTLSLLNQASTGGAGPCHVAVAPSGAHVAVANYSGGSVALLPLGEDGSLSPASAFVQHTGSSVHPKRQEAPHAHSVNFDPAGTYLLSADLGTDQLLVYRYDAAAGTLTPHDPPFAALPPGAGPRHFVFHPSSKFVYVVNELDSTVSVFSWNWETGVLEALQQVGTLPKDFTGDSTTAEIRVHPTGRFLYASNRGHDSIAVFSIDSKTGLLSLVSHSPTGGSTPRNFNLDPTGRFLIAANQRSDSVFLFRVDQNTGALTATGSSVAVGAPVCVLYSR